MQADYQFWVLVGSQILSAGALFLQLNNKIDSKFDSLSKEVTEVKKEVNEVENRLSKEITEIKVEQAKQSGEIHRLGDKVDYLNQRIDFVYSLLPMPKLAIQNPQDNQQ